MTPRDMDAREAGWIDGYAAYERGTTRNPYEPATEPYRFRGWAEGYEAARHEHEDEPPEDA